MAVTLERVKGAVGSEEPDHPAVAQLGSEVISPALVRVVGLKTVKVAFPKWSNAARLAKYLSRLRDTDPEEAVRDLSKSALQ